MFGFGSLRGVTPQVATEVRQRLYRLVFPYRDDEGARSVHRERRYATTEPDRPDEAMSAGRTGSDSETAHTEPAGPRLRRVHLVVVAILLVLALAAALVTVVRRTPTPEPLPEPSPPAATTAQASPSADSGATASTGATPGGTGPRPAEERVIVHVAGKVRTPGVVRLPAGARVVDAIEAAGGAKGNADLGTVNLARPLQDGEQVLVDTEAPPGYVAPGSGTAVPGSDPTAAPIDLNTATLPELELLPGIGPALGQRILDFRAEHGGFTSVEELHEVSGIGEQRFAELADRVMVR